MPTSVDRFRRLTGRLRSRSTSAYRPPVPPREIALLAAILINVMWLMFSLGGFRLWGVSTAAAIAVLTLLLLPKWKHGELPGSPMPAVELLKLPLFWLGFALFGLFWIHAWNLSWIWGVGARGAPLLIPVEPKFSWLPSGIQTPLEENNPFRSMLFYVTPWLTVCIAWVGLMTRRSIGYLMHGITLLGIVYAGITLWQHFTGANKIFGIFETVPERVGTDVPFWGSLINGNHAAYLFIIINGLCQGLFLSCWRRDLDQFRYSGGIWVLYFAASLLVTFAVLLAQSRGAIFFVSLQWLFFLALCSVFFVRRFGAKGFILPVAVLSAMLAVGISFVVNPDVFEGQRTDWNKTFDLMENPEFEARYFMTLIVRDMVKDRPWQGHGAGSWRYTHLPYLANYPEFVTVREYYVRDPQTRERIKRKRIVWFQNAHVDLGEYLVEWGIIGASLPLAAMIWLIARLFRARWAADLGVAMVLFTVFIVWLGALIEFHFRIPLVLMLWCLGFVGIVRWCERESRTSG